MSKKEQSVGNADKSLKNKMRPLGPLVWDLGCALGSFSLHASDTAFKILVERKRM